MKSYSDLQEDLEQRRKELQSKQKKQIEDRKKKAISYRDRCGGTPDIGKRGKDE